MSFKEIAKEAGKAVARQTGIKRIGATKTADLTNTEENDAFLKEIQKLMQIAHKTQELAKLSHFSYLEKLARATKDECKRLFSKIKAENGQGDNLSQYKGHYTDERNKFLNEAHKISRRIYLFCQHIETVFKIQLQKDTIESTNIITSVDPNLLNSFYDEIKNLK